MTSSEYQLKIPRKMNISRTVYQTEECRSVIQSVSSLLDLHYDFLCNGRFIEPGQCVLFRICAWVIINFIASVSWLGSRQRPTLSPQEMGMMFELALRLHFIVLLFASQK